MDSNVFGGLIGTSICGIAITTATTQLQEVVSIVCTIIGLLITIITTIVIPVVKKYINAKKDGKVTIDEVEDIVDTLKDGIDKVNKGDK